MKKKVLRELAEISNSSIAKMGRNENINTEVLVKICSALHCDIGDIMEITSIDENSQDTNNL
jgi:DNA-binding Xre family transcriptional regulator